MCSVTQCIIKYSFHLFPIGFKIGFSLYIGSKGASKHLIRIREVKDTRGAFKLISVNKPTTPLLTEKRPTVKQVNKTRHIKTKGKPHQKLGVISGALRECKADPAPDVAPNLVYIFFLYTYTAHSEILGMS